MIKLLLGLVLVPVLIGVSPLNAAEPAATVTEAVNQVSHGSMQSADSYPAPVGTRLPDGQYLKTGAQARAELTLGNQTITRLGANTVFNYSASKNEIDLQAGTLLFSKPKNGEQMTIKTASVTAAVLGTTGFVKVTKHGFVFGLIEGHATLTIGGVEFHLTSGEVLSFSPGSPPQIYAFNVPLLLETSPLITRFHHHLPNQLYIDKEIADYKELVAEGFIQPPAEPFFLTDFRSSIPTVPIPARDSAGMSLYQFNQPPPPPPTLFTGQLP